MSLFSQSKAVLEDKDVSQDMFDQIDKEEDGLIYVKEVLFYLKALSNDLDQNKEVVRVHRHIMSFLPGA